MILMSLSMAGAASGQTATDRKAISPQKFSRLMKKEGTVVIDVRTPEEYQSGHIPGAVLIDIKKPDFTERVSSLDRSKKYLLYCRSAKRSKAALDSMQALGFPKVFHLEGGIQNWKRDVE